MLYEVITRIPERARLSLAEAKDGNEEDQLPEWKIGRQHLAGELFQNLSGDRKDLIREAEHSICRLMRQVVFF